jgi:hypothetical protein
VARKRSPEAKRRRRERDARRVYTDAVFGKPKFDERVCECPVSHRGDGPCPTCGFQSVRRRNLTDWERDNQKADPIRTYDLQAPGGVAR